MKKTSVLFFVMLLSAASITAKELPIVGKWLLTIAEVEGQFQDVYSEVVFKEDASLPGLQGYAEMDGRVFGKWSYDKKTKSVTIESEMIKEFAGTRKLEIPAKNKIIFSGDGLKLHFLKWDDAEIKKENEASGLLGLWQFTNEEEITYVKFEVPDVVSYYLVTEYSTSSGAGIWMYNSKESSAILVLNNRALSGNNKLADFSSNSFKLIKDGIEITVTKVDQGAGTLEKLSFIEEDMYESQENALLEGVGFLWEDGEAKYNFLKDISSLSYAQSEYIFKLNAFISTQVKTPVTYNEDYAQIIMEPIFGELSSSSMESENLFYPLDVENYYRVTGEESVTVPAGTFTCTVVETILRSFGRIKAKLYLINDKPGVYAKIIVSKEDDSFSFYKKYELEAIEAN